VNSTHLWLAIGLVLVIEGLFPLVSTASWRRRITQVLQMSDGQIRFFALLSVCIGLLLIWSLTE
jgi:uncharacterized protein YjeT (DUF2065 family)